MVVDEEDEGRSNSSFPSPPTPPDDEDEGSSTIPYFIPRRPRVIRMRDLSPATREAMTKEYFDAYDPWTGIRIAATLGLFISLFALFLAYKSRFHNKSSAKRVNAAKTSLYLYDEDELSLSSSVTSGMDADPLPGFRLQEVYVGGASSVVGGASSVVAALKVKRSSSSSRGGGAKGRGVTKREELDSSRSLPCSPLKDEEAGTRQSHAPDGQAHTPGMVDRTRPLRHGSIGESRVPEMMDRTRPLRIDGPIVCEGDVYHAHDGRRSSEMMDRTRPFRFDGSIGEGCEYGHAPIDRRSSEMADRTRPHRIDGPIGDCHAHNGEGLECGRKKKHKHVRRSQETVGAESVVVVVAKKPQDYRSRSTIVSIARRQRLSS